MSERGLTEALLKSAVCNLIEVEHTSQGFEVSLPQIYHSGHNVAVVVRPERDGFMIHDNSAAAMLLTSLGLSVGKRLSDALRPQIVAYGCELTDLRVWRTCDSIENLGVAMTLVGCASRLIADQALRADPAPLHDFKSSLLGKVVSIVGAGRVRTNEEFNGHLGSKYRVSAVVLDKAQKMPVAFVEPIADREAVARRFKQFYDLSLNPALRQIDRIAVYDEHHPLPAGDALLMGEVGNLVRFSDTAQRLQQWATIQ
jgi:hypothetical protein